MELSSLHMMSIFFWFVSFIWIANAFPFFALIPPIAGGIGYLMKDSISCYVGECCRDAVDFNASRLYLDLNSKLHGQHIAIERLFSHLKAHLEDPEPRKALVLSLHGFTGIGKNYASSIIASNVFKKGEKSLFYNFYDGTYHFIFQNMADEYKIKLKADIINGAKKCGMSIFVFDEIHKMPAGVLDSLAPFIGYASSIEGVDYRKLIFLFLGNNGGSVINEYTYNALLNGKTRAGIQYKDLRRVLSSAIFNENGAFQFSQLIQQHSITAVVPFLPLQEVHIRACIKDAAVRMGLEATEEMDNFIIDELDWGPEGTHIFSESGCKLIYEKVGLFLQYNSMTEGREDL